MTNTSNAQKPTADDRPLTFERFSEESRSFSDEFIVRALAQSLPIGPEKTAAWGVKSFFDQAPIDESDRRVLERPEGIISYRRSISDFIARNLQLRTLRRFSDQERSFLKDQKGAYLRKLAEDNDLLGQEITEVFAGNPTPGKARTEEERRRMDSARKFRGMYVQDSKRGVVSLLTTQVDGIRSSVSLQDQAFGLAVMVDSVEYSKRALAGMETAISRRIYLNPQIDATFDIFQLIVDRVNEAGLTMKAKAFDRTYDLVQAGRPDAIAGGKSLRSDGLVIYVPEEDANQVLQVVVDIYRQNRELFKGRVVAKAAYRLADGIAVGDETTVPEKSLTSHRADVIESILDKIRKEVGFSSESQAENRSRAILLFRQLWQQTAKREGINPDNPAFNHRR